MTYKILFFKIFNLKMLLLFIILAIPIEEGYEICWVFFFIHLYKMKISYLILYIILIDLYFLEVNEYNLTDFRKCLWISLCMCAYLFPCMQA